LPSLKPKKHNVCLLEHQVLLRVISYVTLALDLEKKPNKGESKREETIFDYWRPRQW